MARLPGLSPVGEDRGQSRIKDGRSPLRRTTAPTTRLTPNAQAADTYVRPQQPVNDQRLGQLADALTSLNPALNSYLKQSDERREQDQLDRIEFYTEQFKKDREGGAVNAAQVREVFPELVPTVAARIAESIASGDAKEFAQERVQAILEDRNLRLSTEARQAALEGFREEAMGLIGDNPFYGSAFLSQLDKTFAEFETAWMRETAAYHEQVMTERFQDLAAEAIQTGGDLLALDDAWREAGGLDNRQRKDAVVRAAVSLATTSMDPSILQRVPDRFLNAESKATFADTQLAIQRAQHSMWSQQRERAEHARNMTIRQGQTAILDRLANNEAINPLEYRDIPELASFAERVVSMPRVDPTESKATANALENSLLMLGMTGDMDTAFPRDPHAQDFFDGLGVNQETMREYITTNPELNPEEKAGLLQRLDIIYEGVSLLKHPAVTESRGALNRRLNDLQSSIGQKLALVTEGQSLSADAERRYNRRVRTAVQQHFLEHSAMPPSWLMEEIAETAYDEIDAWITERVTNITGLGSLGSDTPTPPNQATPQVTEGANGVPSFEEWSRSRNQGAN